MVKCSFCGRDLVSGDMHFNICNECWDRFAQPTTLPMPNNYYPLDKTSWEGFFESVTGKRAYSLYSKTMGYIGDFEITQVVKLPNDDLLIGFKRIHTEDVVDETGWTQQQLCKNKAIEYYKLSEMYMVDITDTEEYIDYVESKE